MGNLCVVERLVRFLFGGPAGEDGAAAVTVVSAEWHGPDALTLVYRGPTGRVADEILFRHDELMPSLFPVK